MTNLRLVRPRHLMEEVFGMWPFYDSGYPFTYSQSDRDNGSEITESDQSVTIRLEMPGVKKSDISITYHNDIIAIQADKKELLGEDNDRYQHRGISYGNIKRNYSVNDIDFSKATAELDQGVLSLQLPKRPEKQPKTLPIK